VPPFGGKTLGDVVLSVMDGEIVPLDRRRSEIPPELSAAVARCLERRREARFQSVRELAHVLVPFGSPLAREAVDQIEETFLQHTEKRPSDNQLEATLQIDDGALASTLRMGSAEPARKPRAGERPARRSSLTYRIAVVLGLMALLAVAGAVGFVLARR
jgi:hypothetical protein